MPKTVKMCDMYGDVAARVFAMLNPENVRLNEVSVTNRRISIVTDTEPKDLTYPEGWYYAKGCLTNKHKSTSGMYAAVDMFKTNGDIWDAPYCTD